MSAFFRITQWDAWGTGPVEHPQRLPIPLLETQFARIGWLAGVRPQFSTALIVTANETGLLILADAAPPPGRRLVVCWPRLMPGLWVNVRSRSVRRMRSGPFQVRLRWEDRPPGWLLAALTFTPRVEN